MPLAAAVASAAIGAGTSIYGASQAKKANNKAIAAQNAASQQQLAAQQANLDRINGYVAPKVAGGNAAFDQLLAEFGLAPSGGMGGQGGQMQPTTTVRNSAGGSRTVGPAAAGGPDYAGYFASNPDLAADPSLMNSNPGDLTGDGKVDDADRGAWHYQHYGQGEGRNLPTTAPQEPAPATEQPVDPNLPPDLMNAQRPDVGPAPTFERGEDVQMGDYGAAPDLNSFFSNFAEDPGAKYRRDQALDGVNARSAVAGKLRSGDAAKALATLASDLGSQEYGNWFNRQNTLYNNARSAFTQDRSFQGNLWDQQQRRADNNFGDDRAYGTSIWDRNQARSDQNFNTDRGYQTNRADTRISNLFNLSNVGDRATGTLAGASTNFANNASNIYGQQGDNAANAAYGNAAANNYMAQGIGNAAGNLFASWGGGSRSGGGGGGLTSGQAWNNSFGGGWQSPAGHQQFVNTGIKGGIF